MMNEEKKHALLYSRKKLEEIIDNTFEDDYEPSHQLGPDYISPADSYWTTDISKGVKLRLPDKLDELTSPISMVTFMQRAFEKSPNKIALSVKRNNVWNHWSFADFWNDIRIVAKAFIKLGLDRFHVVAKLGFNSPEWIISYMAAIFAGGVTTGIYTTNSPSACEYILQSSNSNIVVVDGELQLKKILQVKDNLPHLKAIIQYTGTPSHEDVFSWEDVKRIGKSVPDAILERRIKSIAVNQCCSIVYTSGTTGNPKGAMLSHDNITRFAHAFTQDKTLDIFRNGSVNYEIVSFLPLNHLGGLCMDLFFTIEFQGHIYFAQPDALKGSLGTTLQEVQPTFFAGVPRVLEKIKEKFEDQLFTMNFCTKMLISWALRCGYTSSVNQLNKSTDKPFGYSFAKQILQKIKLKMGLSNVLFSGVGGAPVSDELLEFYHKLEILLLEVYGLTESTGPVCGNSIYSHRKESTGKIQTEFNEITIDSPDAKGDGEILIRGRQIFMGYLNNEESTNEMIDSDSWCHSGDIGRIDDDGYLYITGRIKEIVITAGGENISPYPIEEAVKNELPIISQAMVVGDKRKYLTMLLTLKTNMDMETLTPLATLTDISRDWCKRIGSSAKTVHDIINGPDSKVMAAVQKGIVEANKKAFSNACKIQKWKILPRDFSIQEGELGNTMKMKRFYILKKYEKIIDELYR